MLRPQVNHLASQLRQFALCELVMNLHRGFAGWRVNAAV